MRLMAGSLSTVELHRWDCRPTFLGSKRGREQACTRDTCKVSWQRWDNWARFLAPARLPSGLQTNHGQAEPGNAPRGA